MPAEIRLADAQSVIWDGTRSLGRRVTAMELLCRSPETSLADLLACLKHPNKVINWAAAQELHRRTGRAEKEDGTVDFVFLGHEDWCDYLKTWRDAGARDSVSVQRDKGLA